MCLNVEAVNIFQESIDRRALHFFFLAPLPAAPFLAGLDARVLSAGDGFLSAAFLSLPAPPCAPLAPLFSGAFLAPFAGADLLLDLDLPPALFPLSPPPPFDLGRPLSPFFFFPPAAAAAAAAAASSSLAASASAIFRSASMTSKARDSRSAYGMG